MPQIPTLNFNHNDLHTPSSFALIQITIITKRANNKETNLNPSETKSDCRIAQPFAICFNPLSRESSPFHLFFLLSLPSSIYCS